MEGFCGLRGFYCLAKKKKKKGKENGGTKYLRDMFLRLYLFIFFHFNIVNGAKFDGNSYVSY